MAVRALVPTGYMVSAAQDGQFVAVTLCSGHQILMNLATGETRDASGAPEEPSRQQADAPCVFAFVAPLATPEIGAALPENVSIETVALVARATVATGRGLAAPPPWSTGPPLTA